MAVSDGKWHPIYPILSREKWVRDPSLAQIIARSDDSSLVGGPHPLPLLAAGEGVFLFGGSPRLPLFKKGVSVFGIRHALVDALTIVKAWLAVVKLDIVKRAR